MGWFSDAVNAVADAVTDTVEAVTDAVTDVVDTVGNVIEDGLDWVADQADKLPWVGGFLGGVVRWLGRSISAAFGFVGAIIKGISSMISGLISGLIRIVGGIFSLNWSLILDGLRDFGAGFLGGIVIIGGKLITFVQTLSYFLEPNKRKLTPDEKRLLKRVFEDSLALYNIRLVEGFAGLFSLNARPFTLGNTIYLKDRDVSKERALLVHECVHVWQYQRNGARYAGDALGAQWFGNEYDWEKEIEDGRTDWVDFNKESQGQFQEHLYPGGELIEGQTILKGDGVFYNADGQKKIGRFVFNTVDHTDRANASVSALRAQKNFRLSQFI